MYILTSIRYNILYLLILSISLIPGSGGGLAFKIRCFWCFCIFCRTIYFELCITATFSRNLVEFFVDLCKEIMLSRNPIRVSCALFQHSIHRLSTSPLSACIVGSGPSGCYTAKYLLKKVKDIEISIIDELPTPFGLVRYGVAPDHADTKNVIHV